MHSEPLAHGAAVQLILFLAATSLIVPAMRRAGLSAVMGFLAIGVLLGPFGLGQLAALAPFARDLQLADVEATRFLAELGVVFLLFAIGLEVSVERLVALRTLVFGLGLSQLAATAAVIAAIALAFGNAAPAAAVIGLAFALSSTAVVLQLLAERRALSGAVGRAGFSVLLLQDLAVAPILALVAAMGASAGGHASGAALPDLLRAFGAAAGAIVGILLIGRFLLRPFFRWVAGTHTREVFVAAALLMVVGAGLAAQALGLSMALGAFLAGVLLAGTEFRHQVETDVEPFKGLLLGLFFATIGMRMDLGFLAAEPLRVLIGLIGLFVVKTAILLPLARAFGLRWPQAIELSLLLAQAGEFAFVVVALAETGGVIPEATADYMLRVVALSLFLTPLAAGVGVRLAKRLEAGGGPTEPIAARGHVLIAGFGRVGQTLADILAQQEIAHVALEADPAKVAQFQARRWPVRYGDASRRDVLAATGAADAAAIVVTMDNAQAVERVVTEARAAWPHVPIYARARDSAQAKRLHELGAALASPEAVEATLQLGEALLNGLGVPDEAARRIIDDRRTQEAIRALAGG